MCPPTLIPQWEAEIRRFVTPGAVDVLRYEGELSKRLTWWDDVFSLSKAEHKILLATPNVSFKNIATALEYTNGLVQAIVSDASAATNGTQLLSSARRFLSTVFNRRIATLIVDEAHMYRNENKQFKLLPPS